MRWTKGYETWTLNKNPKWRVYKITAVSKVITGGKQYRLMHSGRKEDDFRTLAEAKRYAESNL